MRRALPITTLVLGLILGALLPLSAQAQVELAICRRTTERCFECGRARAMMLSIGVCSEVEIDACAANQVCFHLDEVPRCITLSDEVCCATGEPCERPPPCADFALGVGCHGDPGLPGQTCYCDVPSATADAGPPEVDAGPPEIDAGRPTESDAGRPPAMDAGPPEPPAAPVRYFGGGLGSCSAAPGRPGSGLGLLFMGLLALAITLGARLRRSARRAMCRAPQGPRLGNHRGSSASRLHLREHR